MKPSIILQAKPMPGRDVRDVIEQAIFMARTLNCYIEFTGNGIYFLISANSTIESEYDHFIQRMEQEEKDGSID